MNILHLKSQKVNHKRKFILLEVLISISLITICSVYWFRQPRIYENLLRQLQESEVDQLGLWTFSEVTEKFWRGEISWKMLPPLGEKSGAISLAPLPAQGIGWKGSLRRSYTLHTKGEKGATSTSAESKLVSVTIRFRQGKKIDLERTYSLILSRKGQP